MKQSQIKLKTWAGWSITFFLLLVLIHMALPALFLLFQVPSFSIGHQGWILDWQNDSTGSGIQFNLLVLLAMAGLIGLILTLIKPYKKRQL